MMEKKAETLFRKYKTKYIKKFGRHALDNTEIDLFAKSEFGNRYRGSYAQNEMFELKPGFYIINTDQKTGPGIHWIAVVLTNKTAYFYDSFARTPKQLVPHLVKRLTGRKIVSSDRKDLEQLEPEIICGHLSLAWLAVAKDLGISHAKKI
jgi:hypothetical protein